MNANILGSKRQITWVTGLIVLLFIGSLGGVAWATDKPSPVEEREGAPTTITTGSGEKYKTTVDQKFAGELSAEDFRQASLLSSRIVLHLNNAVQSLIEERPEDARGELERGLGLVKVVRDLLPKSEVTTVVSDAKGTEVYRYVDHVQNNRIPLYEGLVEVKVVEAITDAKRDAAEVAGVRLADAELLHTSALLELDYVEAKLKRSLQALPDKPNDALEQLVLAQSQGVKFSVNRQDNPLVAAQMALQLAEQMVEQNRVDAAKANLQQAKNHLVLYRGLIGEKESNEVKKLEEDITALQTSITTAGAAAKIRGFWDDVVTWFSREHREARTATSDGNGNKGRDR